MGLALGSKPGIGKIVAMMRSRFLRLWGLWSAFYLVLAAIGLAVRSRRRRNVGSGPIYYLQAFATDSSLVTDFAITTTTVDWSQLRLVLRTSDVVVLRRREWIQFVLARRDMFNGDDEWQRFNKLVDSK